MELTQINSKLIQVHLNKDKFSSITKVISRFGQVGNVKSYSISNEDNLMDVNLYLENKFSYLESSGFKFSTDKNSPWYLQPNEIIEVIEDNIDQYIIKHEDIGEEEKKHKLVSWLSDVYEKLYQDYADNEVNDIISNVSVYLTTKYPWIFNHNMHIAEVKQDQTYIDPETKEPVQVQNITNTGQQEIVEVKDQKTQEPKYIEKQTLEKNYQPVVTQQI